MTDARPAPGAAQRREYYRVAAAVPVHVRLADRREFGAVTLDVSGGGISVLWPDPLPIGAQAEVELALPAGPARGGPPGSGHAPLSAGRAAPVRAHAEVATVARPAKPGGPFRVGFQFLRIRDADRSRIVRFVMEVQPRPLRVATGPRSASPR